MTYVNTPESISTANRFFLYFYKREAKNSKINHFVDFKMTNKINIMYKHIINCVFHQL